MEYDFFILSKKHALCSNDCSDYLVAENAYGKINITNIYAELEKSSDLNPMENI